jgi:uncharacterized protein with FMN-binding domain
MKKVLKWIGIIFLVFILCMIVFATIDLNEVKKLEIGDIDLSKLEDGTYEGIYNGSRWTNKVSVTIKDKKIESIVVLENDKPITKELFKKVIEQQNLDIDTVGGATADTKSYLKSIENALNK